MYVCMCVCLYVCMYGWTKWCSFWTAMASGGECCTLRKRQL